MTRSVIHHTILDGEEHALTITPEIKDISGGNSYLTGVYKLSEGDLSMGEIVFDDDMEQWEYTGMGDISHDEAEKIATFIKSYQEPA